MLTRIFRILKVTGREAAVLWYVCRNASTPVFIKITGALMVFYLFSPVDFIPDGLPILGWMDDVTLIAFGIPFLLKLVPGAVLLDAQDAAQRSFSKWSLRRRKT